MGIAHLALDLRLRGERGHRVDDHHVDGAGANEGIGDLEGLLARVRLRDQQIVDVEADLLRVPGVERMLGVDERRGAAPALGLRDHFEGQGRLSGRFRPVDLDDAAAGQPSDAEGGVEAERPGGDRIDVPGHRRIAEAHDRAPSELPVELTEGSVERGFPTVVRGSFLRSPCHRASFLLSGEGWVRREPAIIPHQSPFPRGAGARGRTRGGAPTPPPRAPPRRTPDDG